MRMANSKWHVVKPIFDLRLLILAFALCSLRLAFPPTRSSQRKSLG